MPDERPPGQESAQAPPIDYIKVQESPEFTELKRRFRRFVFPVSVAFFVWFIGYVLLAAYAHDFMATPVLDEPHVSVIFVTAFFLVWYLTYVLLADYAHGFMSTQVWGNINVGLLLGLGQFVTTFAITMIYVKFANKRLDPLSVDIRADLEERAGTATPGGDR